MKKIRPVSVRSLCILSFGVLLCASACGGDSLGKTFQKKSPTPEDLGPLSAISPGSTYRYSIASTYRPVSGNDAGTSNSLPEQQAYAQLCLKVDEVRDTATSAYKAAAETVVVGRMKVDGGAASPDILVTDEVNSSVDPSAVDFAQRNLWLRKLTFPNGRS